MRKKIGFLKLKENRSNRTKQVLGHMEKGMDPKVSEAVPPFNTLKVLLLQLLSFMKQKPLSMVE